RLPVDLRPLVRMNATDVRTSRLNADAWDLTGATVVALGGMWPPDEPGGKLYALLSGLYALCAGATVLLVLIASMFASMFGTTVSMNTILGALCFVGNAVLLLRLPVHQWVRTLTRQRALTLSAVLHLLAFAVLVAKETTIDGVMIFVFGLVPAV